LILHALLPGHQLNVNGYTTQELLEKVQLADSLFDQGTHLPGFFFLLASPP